MTVRNYAIYDPKSKTVLAKMSVHDDDKECLKKIKAREIGDAKVEIGYQWDEVEKKFIHPLKLWVNRKMRQIRKKKNVSAVEKK